MIYSSFINSCKSTIALQIILICTNIQYSFAEPTNLPLITIGDLKYKGAFRLPEGMFGSSDFSYAEGPIEVNPDNNSLFIVGHSQQQAIAEITIPTLVNSTNLSDLNIATRPLQNFSKVLNRGVNTAGEEIDRIGGIAYIKGQLIINGYNYYNADGNYKDTTLILRDSQNLADSTVNGYFQLNGSAHAAGYTSAIPIEWQTSLGGTHISGLSGINIAARTSIGPSAFAWSPEDTFSNYIAATPLLDYPLDYPLNQDFYNDTRQNDIWTFLSKAAYGFIIPGTRTFAALGYSGGHEHGAGYKPTQDTGNVCGGPCSLIASDNYNYYWLFDVNDLLRAKNGEINPHDIKPYKYGIFNTPHRYSTNQKIKGGTFDSSTGTLYLSLEFADSKAPIIISYQITTNSTGQTPTDPDPTPTDPDPTPTEPTPITALANPPANFSSRQASTTPTGSTNPPSNGSGNQAIPTLPTPTGAVVNVSNESELQTAISNLVDNSTIILAPGQYNLTNTLYIRNNDVTITGSTNNYDDVVLLGKGMEQSNYGNVPHGIWSDSLRLTVANLTIRDVYSHGIIFNPGAEEPHILNVKLLNTGEQFIKANPVAYANGVDNGLVEYSVMEYTNGAPNTDHGGGIGYTNGIDVHGGNNWIIRKNLFKNFHTPDTADTLWAPAVLMWNGAQGTVTDSNTFINVDRAIAYGLMDRGASNDHSGGIIKNNMVYYAPELYSSARTTESDAAIIVWDSPQTKIYHNTILANGNLNKSIELRFNTANADIKNNLLDTQIGQRNGGTYTSSGNLFSANASMFVNPSIGDLHLKSVAITAIDQVRAPGDSLSDFDGQSRPQNGSADIGADELN